MMPSHGSKIYQDLPHMRVEQLEAEIVELAELLDERMSAIQAFEALIERLGLGQATLSDFTNLDTLAPD